MYQFFVKREQVNGKEITITGSDVNHISHVLRMKPGEPIGINDGQDTWRCRILALEEDRITAVIEEKAEGNELSSRIYLFQGLPKADKMETIIQKSVELGVYEIIPVAMRRCVVRLDEKKQAAKQKRWQAIAESAAKQAKRDLIPAVREVMEYGDALAYASGLDVFLLPYEHAEGMAQTRRLLSSIPRRASVGILIGPEGGFEEEEVSRAAESGAGVITLGRRILRTETAGPAVLAMLNFCLEED